MLYSTATTCTMLYPKDGKAVLLPKDENYIIAIKTIHPYLFQQKLYRPTSLLGHGTEVAILFVLWLSLWF